MLHCSMTVIRRDLRVWRVPAWLTATVILAACAYHGDIDNPLVRKTQWFSYLDGSDIRAACVEGAAERYRLVYNGKYNEQLRSYEIFADGTGGGNLEARAIGQSNLAEVTLDDVLAPWRWRRSQAHLSPRELDQLRASLEKGGLYDGAPIGLRLFSGDFYWVASGCRDGVFHYNAWLYPTERAARLSFPDFLYARDKTELAVNPPRFVPEGERIGQTGRSREEGEIRFWLQVREDGLGGTLNAF